MALASGIHAQRPLRPACSTSEIVGRLGFVAYVRRAQAALVAVLLVAASVASINSFGWSSSAYGYALVLGHSMACFLAIRHFPYCNPRQSLKEGLVALSRHRLNDPASFLAHQRTDVSAVSNRLLSDLCMQLTIDSRRAR